MELLELAAKCKAVMVAHLKTKGYPNLTPAQILAELKPLWIALEEANLKQTGMSYQVFCKTAESKALENMDMDDMVDLLLRGIKR